MRNNDLDAATVEKVEFKEEIDGNTFNEDRWKSKAIFSKYEYETLAKDKIIENVSVIVHPFDELYFLEIDIVRDSEKFAFRAYYKGKSEQFWL